MDFSDNPNVFIIAISLVLFLIKIVKPEMILNAATIIIKSKYYKHNISLNFKSIEK